MTSPENGRPIDAAPLFGAHMPIHQIPDEAGRFVIATDFGALHLNRAGTVHGGLIASFLDVAVAGGAGHAAGDLEKWFGVTLTLTVNYIAAAQPGPARCVAEALGGRTTKTMHARLYDSADTLVASATGTVRVVAHPQAS